MLESGLPTPFLGDSVSSFSIAMIRHHEQKQPIGGRPYLGSGFQKDENP